MSHNRFPTANPAVITCGLPYANGELHIGHLRTYISGDVLARALRKLGQPTAFVCGSDMHGTPIAVNARQEGVSPEEFALQWHEQYQETFPQFNIEFDNYGHTHDETNPALTQELVRSLDERGYIYESEVDVAWDADVDQPLPDRYIEGICPYCGAVARGDECENCGRHLEPGELKEPRSVLTGNPAEYRRRRHKFFRLSEFQEYLHRFIGRLEGTDNARNQPREWIDTELRDWGITRDLEWGIPYPDEAEDLVLYVWVDAPIEYIASTKQYTERVGTDVFDWTDVWKDGNGEVVHVIGRDIIQHHTVFWPALLRAVEYTEPRAVMASGFVNLDGQAFSTSRGYAIWVDDYLDTGFHPDLYRYYSATGSTFQQDIEFSWDRFAERVNSELVGTVGNFLYRTLLFAYRNYEGTPDMSLSADVHDRIQAAIDEFVTAINEYSIRAAGTAAVNLARFGNEYLQRTEPWNLVDADPEQSAQVIRDCVQLVKAIAVLIEPVMPQKAEQLWQQLDEAESVRDVSIDTALEAPTSTFDEPTPLFEKIPDDRITALTEELQRRSSNDSMTGSEGNSTNDQEGE
jgi:methionyl-tRNA synthetase